MKFNIGGSFIAQVVDILIPLFTKIMTVIIENKITDMVTTGALPSMFNDPVS